MEKTPHPLRKAAGALLLLVLLYIWSVASIWTFLLGDSRFRLLEPGVSLALAAAVAIASALPEAKRVARFCLTVTSVLLLSAAACGMYFTGEALLAIPLTDARKTEDGFRSSGEPVDDWRVASRRERVPPFSVGVNALDWRVETPEYRLLSPDPELPGEYGVDDRFVPGAAPEKGGRPSIEELKDEDGVWVERLWMEDGMLWERDPFFVSRPGVVFAVREKSGSERTITFREKINGSAAHGLWRIEVDEARVGDREARVIVAARWDPGVALTLAAWPLGLVGLLFCCRDGIRARRNPPSSAAAPDETAKP